MESKKESQNSSQDNNNLFNNDNIQELIDLKDKLTVSLSDKSLQASFLNDLKLKLYRSLYENHSFKNKPEIIEDIIKDIEEFILIQNSIEMITPIIETLESVMMLFLFHFDLNIIKIGFSLVKFLIDNLEESYCGELLDYFLKIMQLLNIKKRINNENTAFISSTIIYNLSLAIYIILADTQILKENKKPFFDFVKKNISDVNLLYLLLFPYVNNQIKNEKIFGNEEIKFIYEKIGEALNNTYTDLTNNLQKIKTDLLYIKEKMNKIGMLCRILNCVTLEGHKTYIIDKLIKNMMPLSQRILDTFNYFCGFQNSELKFPAETIENIFGYFKALGVFSFEKILKPISFVNKMFYDYSSDYLSIIIHLIEELNRIALNFESPEDNNIKKIILLLTQIIEIVLQKNKTRNNDKVCLDIYEFYLMNKIYQIILKLEPNITFSQNKCPNIYKFFVEEKDKNPFEEMEKGFNDKNFDYQTQIYLNCISAGNKANNMINKQTFIDCFNKFIEFKNSIKEPLLIKNEFEMDKSIEEEKKEMVNKQNISQDEFKTFFLKNSMEMFNEICKKNQ
jgi:hypothetical protein